MAFLIRTIDFTSSGREIVRDRTLEQAEITIGRASENDIHLADLAVEQRHVKIADAGGGMLLVEAVSGLGFGIDGRIETHANVDPNIGAELELGSSLLAISRDGDGPVQIVIQQAARDEAAGDALQGFALESALPSKRAMAWTMAVAILLLLLTVPIISHMTRTQIENDPEDLDRGQVLLDAAWSAGDLSLKHHELEGNCEACHVSAFVSVQDTTCLTCHEELGDHAAMPRLAEGMAPLSTGDAIQWSIAETLGKEGPLGCVSCHAEHEGAVRMEAANEAFCADCHTDMDMRLSDTALGNADDFGEQHPQFRPTFYTAHFAEEPSRVALDQNPVEMSGLIFPHNIHMDAQGGVARMALSLSEYGAPLECSDCHSEEEDGIGFAPVEMEASCESCHSLVFDRAGPNFRSLTHGDVDDLMAELASMDRGPSRAVVTGRSRPGQFAQGGRYYSNFGRPMRTYIAINRALEPGGACAECHIPTTTNGRRDLTPVNLPDRFLMHGFFSHKAHEEEDCTDCHATETSDEATDLLIPDLASCRDCHLGQSAIKTEEIVPSGCAMCHGYHTPAMPWRPEDHPDFPGDGDRGSVAAILSGLRR